MRIADAPDGAPNYVKMWQVAVTSSLGLASLNVKELFKGIVICHFSSPRRRARETVFDLLWLYVPLVMVTYDTAEEIIAVLAKGDKPWLSMEMRTSTVYTWGHQPALCWYIRWYGWIHAERRTRCALAPASRLYPDAALPLVRSP